MSEEIFFYDRAFVFPSPQAFAEFVENPEVYLRKIGALDGLDEFNGIRILGDPDATLESFAASSTSNKTPTLVHRGVPYQDFCGWDVIP